MSYLAFNTSLECRTLFHFMRLTRLLFFLARCRCSLKCATNESRHPEARAVIDAITIDMMGCCGSISTYEKTKLNLEMFRFSGSKICLVVYQCLLLLT